MIVTIRIQLKPVTSLLETPEGIEKQVRNKIEGILEGDKDMKAVVDSIDVVVREE